MAERDFDGASRRNWNLIDPLSRRQVVHPRGRPLIGKQIAVVGLTGNYGMLTRGNRVGNQHISGGMTTDADFDSRRRIAAARQPFRR